MNIRVNDPGRGHNEYGEGACRMGRLVKTYFYVSLCPRALQTGRQSQPTMGYITEESVFLSCLLLVDGCLLLGASVIAA